MMITSSTMHRKLKAAAAGWDDQQQIQAWSHNIYVYHQQCRFSLSAPHLQTSASSSLASGMQGSYSRLLLYCRGATLNPLCSCNASPQAVCSQCLCCTQLAGLSLLECSAIHLCDCLCYRLLLLCMYPSTLCLGLCDDVILAPCLTSPGEAPVYKEARVGAVHPVVRRKWSTREGSVTAEERAAEEAERLAYPTQESLIAALYKLA